MPAWHWLHCREGSGLCALHLDIIVSCACLLKAVRQRWQFNRTATRAPSPPQGGNTPLRGGGSIADFYIEEGIDEEGGFGIQEWLEFHSEREEEQECDQMAKIRWIDQPERRRCSG